MAILKYDIAHSYASSFKEGLVELIARIDPQRVPVRVVVFGNPLSEEQYVAERFLIVEALFDRYGDRSPVISYVAQTPLAATLVMESQTIAPELELAFALYGEHRYAKVMTEEGKMIFTEGILPLDLGAPIIAQSSEVFGVVGDILRHEDLSPGDISRQWNYIEQITSIRNERQNYQEFNDARTDFYSTTLWKDGYPAATGIGTAFGGVMVEIDAAKLTGARIVALDNSLQVAAHEYSKQVLLGSTTLSTPKFERAKAVDYGHGMVKIYISGTAAIRGEDSLTGVGIDAQTLATLENIEFLCSTENLSTFGVRVDSAVHYSALRVYLKFRSDYLAAREIIEQRYGLDLPVLYVLTDVCRDELLIEIEGTAEYNPNKC
ncbi:MAG: endoribonuclease L-PSP [Mucinivorans sp.]